MFTVPKRGKVTVLDANPPESLRGRRRERGPVLPDAALRIVED